MKALAKAGVVSAGYVVAFAIASVSVFLYVAATSYVDRVTYSGMTAFGDSMVFLAAFAVAAVPATCAAFYFLRPYPRFWTLASVVALAIAATGFAAGVEYLAPHTGDVTAPSSSWSALSVLRLLVAPFFAGAFLLAGVFAPKRSARIALLTATAMDAVAFAVFALTLALRATR